MKQKTGLITLILILLLLSSCASSSFPTKAQISVMTDEKARQALINKTAQEIHDNWGEPDNFFSGLYGDIYTYEGKSIAVYYNNDSDKVTDVVIWENDSLNSETTT